MATPLMTKETSKSITLFSNNAGIAFQNEGRMCLPRFELKLTMRYDPAGFWSRAIGIIASIKTLVTKVLERVKISKIRGKRQAPLTELEMLEDSFNDFAATMEPMVDTPLRRGAVALYEVSRSQLTRISRKENNQTIVEWVTHPAWLTFSIERGDRAELVRAMGLEGKEEELLFVLVTALRTRGRNLNISSVVTSAEFALDGTYSGNPNFSGSEQIFLQYLHRLKVANRKAQQQPGVAPDALRQSLGLPIPYETAIIEFRRTMREMESSPETTVPTTISTSSGSTRRSLMTERISRTTSRPVSTTRVPTTSRSAPTTTRSVSTTSRSVSTSTIAMVVRDERTRRSTAPDQDKRSRVESVTRIYDPENEFREVIERDVPLWDTSIGNEAGERQAALQEAHERRKELDKYIRNETASRTAEEKEREDAVQRANAGLERLREEAAKEDARIAAATMARAREMRGEIERMQENLLGHASRSNRRLTIPPNMVPVAPRTSPLTTSTTARALYDMPVSPHPHLSYLSEQEATRTTSRVSTSTRGFTRTTSTVSTPKSFTETKEYAVEQVARPASTSHLGGNIVEDIELCCPNPLIVPDNGKTMQNIRLLITSVLNAKAYRILDNIVLQNDTINQYLSDGLRALFVQTALNSLEKQLKEIDQFWWEASKKAPKSILGTKFFQSAGEDRVNIVTNPSVPQQQLLVFQPTGANVEELGVLENAVLSYNANPRLLPKNLQSEFLPVPAKFDPSAYSKYRRPNTAATALESTMDMNLAVTALRLMQNLVKKEQETIAQIQGGQFPVALSGRPMWRNAAVQFAGTEKRLANAEQLLEAWSIPGQVNMEAMSCEAKDEDCMTPVVISKTVPVLKDTDIFQKYDIVSIPTEQREIVGQRWKQLSVPEQGIVRQGEQLFALGPYSKPQCIGKTSLCNVCHWERRAQKPLSKCLKAVLTRRNPWEFCKNRIIPVDEIVDRVERLDTRSYAFNDVYPGTLTEVCAGESRTSALPSSGILTFDPACKYRISNGPFRANDITLPNVEIINTDEPVLIEQEEPDRIKAHLKEYYLEYVTVFMTGSGVLLMGLVIIWKGKNIQAWWRDRRLRNVYRRRAAPVRPLNMRSLSPRSASPQTPIQSALVRLFVQEAARNI